MIEIKPEAKKTDGITNDLVEITRPSIEKRIYVIRDKQVMLDSDLAILYQVETGALNRAVKRNISRFPFSAHERGVSELEMPNWHFKFCAGRK